MKGGCHADYTDRYSWKTHLPFDSTTPPPTAASTALGKQEIINYTKKRILPDPDSSELAGEEENSATRVLAAAIYLKLENMFFDETSSRVDLQRPLSVISARYQRPSREYTIKGDHIVTSRDRKQETKEVVQIRANKRPKNLKPQRHEPRHLKHRLHKHMKSKSSLKTHFRRSLTPALIFLPV